jgi:hypothetical protein
MGIAAALRHEPFVSYQKQYVPKNGRFRETSLDTGRYREYHLRLKRVPTPLALGE